MKSASNPVTLREEFWSASAESLHDRETIGAAVHLGLDSMESLAIRGGGPPYIRIGRRALYRKADVLNWIDRKGQRVENTAQLTGAPT